MKKSYFVGLALCVLCVVAVFVYSNREQAIAELCPAVTNGEYDNVTIQWYALRNDDNDCMCEATLSDKELQDIFSGVRLKRGTKTNQTPDASFEMRLWSGQTAYSIVVGIDNTVRIAQVDDLEKTRTFWVDAEGELFAALYDLHLSNGGRNIPEITGR